MNTPLLVATLGLPARVNNSYGAAVTSHGEPYRYVKPSVKTYKKWAHKILAAYYTPQPWRVWQDGAAIAAARNRSTKERALRVVTWFYFQTANSDIDGPLKCLLDMLKSYLAIDDRYVYELEVRKFVDHAFERVEFSVEACERTAPQSLFELCFNPYAVSYGAVTRADLPRITA